MEPQRHGDHRDGAERSRGDGSEPLPPRGPLLEVCKAAKTGSGGLKGRNLIAQGNALGKRGPPHEP